MERGEGEQVEVWWRMTGFFPFCRGRGGDGYGGGMVGVNGDETAGS
jgi:hypothetical protein